MLARQAPMPLNYIPSPPSFILNFRATGNKWKLSFPQDSCSSIGNQSLCDQNQDDDQPDKDLIKTASYMKWDLPLFPPTLVINTLFLLSHYSLYLMFPWGKCLQLISGDFLTFGLWPKCRYKVVSQEAHVVSAPQRMDSLLLECLSTGCVSLGQIYGQFKLIYFQYNFMTSICVFLDIVSIDFLF